MSSSDDKQHIVFCFGALAHLKVIFNVVSETGFYYRIQSQWRISTKFTELLSDELEPRNKNQCVTRPMVTNGNQTYPGLRPCVNWWPSKVMPIFGSLTWPWKITGWHRTLKPGTTGFLAWQATRIFLVHSSSPSRSQFSILYILFSPLYLNEKGQIIPTESKTKIPRFYDQSAYRMKSRCKLLSQGCPSKCHQYVLGQAVITIFGENRWSPDGFWCYSMRLISNIAIKIQ